MRQQQRTQGQPKKPETVHLNQLDWSEYDAGKPGEEAVSVIAQGYELIVGHVLDDEQKPTGAWSWVLRSTSQVSESPDVIDLGEARSMSGGQIAAKEALNRERRSAYKRARANVGADREATHVEPATKAPATVPKNATVEEAAGDGTA